MAASIAARSSVTSIYRQITARPSPSDREPRYTVKFREPYIRRRNVRLSASVNSNDGAIDGNSDRKAPALELPSFDDDASYDVVSEDPLHLLPKPLSSAQYSKPVADGSRLRVAYQGVRGAYSESAAEKAYPNCEAVPCDQFDAAFQFRLLAKFLFVKLKVSINLSAILLFLSWSLLQAVERWLVDRAVLPIENSLGGSIHRNYDLLLRHRLHIVGEVKLAVRHCLLANQGVKVEDLKRVLSHPQALAQCENTLTKLGLVREAVDDTAGAAKDVAFQNLKDTGAVASSAAASIYGLNILAEDIQDDCDNVTRFLMLAREPIIPGTDRPFKTSIVFSLEWGPGALFKALAVFALRQINLTKIESRPLRNQPSRSSDIYFDYLFYVDFEASMADQNAQNALRHLKVLFLTHVAAECLPRSCTFSVLLKAQI
ncbi:hypothetical protein JRO89_XS10G0152600 [Xanthoceras sorbifolium]|uniref:Arogenate dehydratase n=1 Tax=Xanthoceras sorbifolium TaxID=99658 RepID=A0ABQ8HIU4_9ROSI|nr:hypothetical protein JRO89_XS10G0152600 [Xanthoceras sorbifolium]